VKVPLSSQLGGCHVYSGLEFRYIHSQTYYPMHTLYHDEIIGIHEFFEDWLNGRIPDDDATLDLVQRVLADDFEIISPNGNRHSKTELLANLGKAHGCWSGERIWIKNISVKQPAGPAVLVTYEEWQGTEDNSKGRLSSAWLAPTGDEKFPVRWLHLHEVWIDDN